MESSSFQGGKNMKKLVAFIMVIVLSIVLVACQPKEAEKTLDAAEVLIDDDSIDDAIDMIEDILDDDEENYEAWELLVKAYIEDEEYDDAAKVLEDLAEIIVDNYEEDDKDSEEAMEIYTDLAKDITKEDEDINIPSINLLVSNLAEDNPEITEEAETTKMNEVTETTTEESEIDDVTTLSPPVIEGIDLTYGQTIVDIDEEGTVYLVLYLEKERAAEQFGFDEDISLEDLEEFLEDRYDRNDVSVYSVHMDDASLIIVLTSLDLREFIGYKQRVQDIVYGELDGDYNAALDGIELSTYDRNELLTSDDYKELALEVLAEIEASDMGTYFNFPFDIVAISECEHKVIDDNIVFLEGYESAEVILDESIFQFAPSVNDYSSVSENTGVEGEILPDSQAILKDGEVMYSLLEGGDVIMTTCQTYEDFEVNYGVSPYQSTEQVREELDLLYKEFIVVTYDIRFQKYESLVEIKLYLLNIGNEIGVSTVEEFVDYYYDGDYTSCIESEELIDYETGRYITVDELIAVADYNVFDIDSYDTGWTFIEFPGEIIYISEGYDHYKSETDNTFTTLRESYWGMIIFDGPFAK